MIQPVLPRQDNRPLPGAEKETPELYGVGCAGYVEQWEKLPDGRYVLELRGMNRFRSEAELPLHRGYRRVKANYSGFADLPLDKNWRCDRPRLLKALQEYARGRGLQVRHDQAEKVSDIELINMLGMSLPFHPPERQALLEAPSLSDREHVLIDLLQFGTVGLNPEQPSLPRTVH
jgi:Lon protease-like protein